MADDISSQLLLTTWLDDQNGLAKLTVRQRELINNLEELGAEQDNEVRKKNHEHLSNAEPICQDVIKLQHILRPCWKANEIIRMFHDEQLKIVERGIDCKKLLEKSDLVLNEILSLEKLYLYVSPRTSQLHSECKSIIQERNDLRVSYERITSSLNKQEELKSIIRRMPDIRNQIVSVLSAVFQGYQNNNQEPEGAIPLDEYYGRFFIECRRIKELTSQLESCLSSFNTEELLLHLEEIYTIYFDIRERLIEPVFTKNLKTLILKAERNFCDLVRQTSTSLVRILRNEIQLFTQIFPLATSTTDLTSANQSTNESNANFNSTLRIIEHPLKRQILTNFLELLCKIFYEHIRPVVIHVNHLETLAELYKLIHDTMRSEAEQSYEQMMNALAEDVQERMVFRTEVFIKDSILDYKPSSGDLAWPEVLEIIPGELKNFQSMWYPTVQRSVLALFYLNRVFDRLTFRELAQEVVLACLKSLDTAKKLVDERHNGTKIEAALFLSKHVAIINDQLSAYGIENVDPIG